jgi:diacylglycerol kinase
MAAELLNTSLEALADTLHPQRAEGIGRAKDAAAGAVLVTAILAGIVGSIVFGPKLWDFVSK